MRLGAEHVEIDQRYLRPSEVELLLGDSSKARKALKWEPRVDFKTLVSMMVKSDLALAENDRERALPGHGAGNKCSGAVPRRAAPAYEGKAERSSPGRSGQAGGQVLGSVLCAGLD